MKFDPFGEELRVAANRQVDECNQAALKVAGVEANSMWLAGVRVGFFHGARYWNELTEKKAINDRIKVLESELYYLKQSMIDASCAVGNEIIAGEKTMSKLDIAINAMENARLFTGSADGEKGHCRRSLKKVQSILDQALNKVKS